MKPIATINQNTPDSSIEKCINPNCKCTNCTCGSNCKCGTDGNESCKCSK